GSPVMTDVTHMIVHHSAGPNNSSNWGAAVLAIWNLHKNTNGWDDIGYNWLIDPDGVIYEGRGGGNNVRGAHFCGKNTGTMGICFLGNFETATPTPEALASLETLLAWKSCDSGLDPKGTALHASSGLNLHTISGHRDGCNTLCPGANLFPLIASQVRNNADSILTACTSVTSLEDFNQISELNVYPNPSEGEIEVSWTAIKSGEVVMEVLNYQGQVFMQRDVNLFFGKQSLQLNLPNMSSGIYLLRFRNKKGTLTRKIVLL
ncbi:MAG: N-acetylmuramoyl-L-alanine amidase, partial [Bacteroidota bacterium]